MASDFIRCFALTPCGRPTAHAKQFLLRGTELEPGPLGLVRGCRISRVSGGVAGRPRSYWISIGRTCGRLRDGWKASSRGPRGEARCCGRSPTLCALVGRIWPSASFSPTAPSPPVMFHLGMMPSRSLSVGMPLLADRGMTRGTAAIRPTCASSARGEPLFRAPMLSGLRCGMSQRNTCSDVLPSNYIEYSTSWRGKMGLLQVLGMQLCILLS